MTTSRKPYPSDVSDEEWALAAPYLTLLPEDAGQRTHRLREVFDGLRYLVRYGVPWRALSNDLPPWHAVYDQAQRWLRAGSFEMLAHDPRGAAPGGGARGGAVRRGPGQPHAAQHARERRAGRLGRSQAHTRLEAAPRRGHARPPARAPRDAGGRERPCRGRRVGRGRAGRHRRARRDRLRRPGLHRGPPRRGGRRARHRPGGGRAARGEAGLRPAAATVGGTPLYNVALACWGHLRLRPS